MRTIYLISLILFFPSTGKSQTDSITGEYRGLVLFRLGDPVTKFSNQLTCDYNYRRKEPATLDSPLRCRGYYYLPADNHQVEVGSLKFRYAFLFPDGKRNIRSVVFSKSYVDNDSLEIGNAEADFNYLKKYLDGYFNVKGKKQKISSQNNRYSSLEKVTWIIDDSCYVIHFTTFKQRSADQKVASILSMSYFYYRLVVDADPKMVSLLEYK